MSNKSNPTVATMGIDIGKNSFHVVGLDQRGAIVLRQKWSRRQIEAWLANIPRSDSHAIPTGLRKPDANARAQSAQHLPHRCGRSC
jgi:hypothetical protein